MDDSIIKKTIERRAKCNFTNDEQDRQYDALRRAQVLGKEGKLEEAIAIAEKVMYEEGCICMGVTWPFILSELYLKNNMNDECWKYLNFISVVFPDEQSKIDDVRVKILKTEGKHLDAMATKMRSILFKYSLVEFTPELEKVEKDLLPFIKRAGLTDKKADLLALMNRYLYLQTYKSDAFRDELKNVINKRQLSQ